MKKFYIVLLIFILGSEFLDLFLYSYDEGAISNPFDYARITEVDYKAVVVDEPNSNGKVLITERLTFDIHAADENNLFWELWRDLPESYIDGLKVEYKVNSVKQIFEDNSEVIYKESPELYWDDYDYINTAGGYGPGKWYHSEGPYNEEAALYECVFFYVDGLYREEVVFEIEYEMTNAALRYNDVSELYLTLYSEETIKYLESFKGQILFPIKDMPSTGNYEAYTYGTNAHSFPFTESRTLNPGYHTFSFELDESDLQFRSYNQYIEFSLIAYGADRHIFTQYAPNNYYSSDDVLEELRQSQTQYEALPKIYFKRKIITLLLSLTGALLLIRYVLKKDKKMREKHNFYESTMQFEYFREIPSNLDPYFASALVFCKHKSTKNDANGYAATMLSLVRKGYIELNKINEANGWTFSNVKIIVKLTQSTLLEQKLLEMFKEKQPIPTTQVGQQPVESSGIAQRNQQFMFEQKAFETLSTEVTGLEPLTPAEEYYFNLIVRHSHGNEISMNSFQEKVSRDYENTNSFVKNMENSIVNIGISQGYFQKADYTQPKKELKSLSTFFAIIGVLVITLGNLISYQTRLDLAFGAFFILGIGFIISALYLNKLSKKYILLTQFGEDEYAKWRGLYNFLNSETLMSERTVIELPLWEQYLVYATAFGISEKVIKALEIRCPDIDNSTMLRNPYYRSTSFRTSSRSFRTATRTASSTARSGGFSGHGGYGGGGRGGGGGGGGH